MTDHSRQLRAIPTQGGGVHPQRRGEWGTWRLDSARLVLWTGKPGSRYEIELEGCTTSAEVLDWISQIAGKSWADDKTLAGLVRAFDDLLVPQENLCSWGRDSELSPQGIRELVTEATVAD